MRKQMHGKELADRTMRHAAARGDKHMAKLAHRVPQESYDRIAALLNQHEDDSENEPSDPKNYGR